jgi:hypothetical protein
MFGHAFSDRIGAFEYVIVESYRTALEFGDP